MRGNFDGALVPSFPKVKGGLRLAEHRAQVVILQKGPDAIDRAADLRSAGQRLACSVVRCVDIAIGDGAVGKVRGRGRWD